MSDHLAVCPDFLVIDKNRRIHAVIDGFHIVWIQEFDFKQTRTRIPIRLKTVNCILAREFYCADKFVLCRIIVNIQHAFRRIIRIHRAVLEVHCQILRAIPAGGNIDYTAVCYIKRAALESCFMTGIGPNRIIPRFRAIKNDIFKERGLVAPIKSSANDRAVFNNCVIDADKTKIVFFRGHER